MMPGGDRDGYDELAPILTKIAAQVDDGPCVTYCGPGGAGHYVKMVHNGIEYGDMQLIAEAYDVLQARSAASSNAELADVFAEWNAGELAVVPHRDHRARSSARRIPRRAGDLVDMILDAAAQKGTGKWTVQDARRARRRRSRPSPPSVEARVHLRRDGASASQAAKLLAGPDRRARVARRQEAARRRRARRALRREGVQLRAGHEPAPRRPRDARELGPQPRRARAHLEGRLHHPRAVPRPHQGGLRPRRRRSPNLLLDPRVPRGARRRGRTAGGASSRSAIGAGSRCSTMSGVARLLRQHPPRAPAGEPHPGAARLLRRAHLRAPRQAGHVPHRVVREVS